MLVAHPQVPTGGVDHVLPELQLVGLLDIRLSRGRADLRHLFEPDVLLVPGNCELDVIRQGEEGFRSGEDGFLVGCGDAMVDYGEEANVFSRVD